MAGLTPPTKGIRDQVSHLNIETEWQHGEQACIDLNKTEKEQSTTREASQTN